MITIDFNNRLSKAFSIVNREDFVPTKSKKYAKLDVALPIASKQTISQPSTVAFMLSILEPQEGNIIFDIGAGTGWQSALLAFLVGPKGKVYAIEINDKMFNILQDNLQKYPEFSRRIVTYHKNAVTGLPEVAAKIDGFDRIISAAEVMKVPDSWKQQLKIGGRMVYPQNGSLIMEKKIDFKNFKKIVYPGFSFVPFVEENN